MGNRPGRVAAQHGELAAKHDDRELLRGSKNPGQAHVRIFGADKPRRSRATMCFGRARVLLDRHDSYIVAALLAGAAR